MICKCCGADFDVQGNRCPECGTVYEVQCAPPRVEPGPTILSQTRATVIPKNVPIGKFRPSAGWIASIALLAAVMIGILVFILFVEFQNIQ